MDQPGCLALLTTKLWAPSCPACCTEEGSTGSRKEIAGLKGAQTKTDHTTESLHNVLFKSGRRSKHSRYLNNAVMLCYAVLPGYNEPYFQPFHSHTPSVSHFSKPVEIMELNVAGGVSRGFHDNDDTNLLSENAGEVLFTF